MRTKWSFKNFFFLFQPTKKGNISLSAFMVWYAYHKLLSIIPAPQFFLFAANPFIHLMGMCVSVLSIHLCIYVEQKG